MRVGRSLFAIVAVSFLSVFVPRTAAADEWNRETVLTFSRDVEIPGKVLSAGKYVFRVAPSPANHHVVQVFDQAGRIVATVLTIASARLTPTADTHVMFEEASAGGPLPIKKWFYPGYLDGEEFIYPSRSN